MAASRSGKIEREDRRTVVIGREPINNAARLSRLICKIDNGYNKTTVKTAPDGKIVILLLTIWFCLALFVGFLEWFHAASAPMVAATVWTLTALALFACWIVAPLRRWASIVDLGSLIAFHLIRFVAGVYFIFDYRAGLLPRDFALPAAYGDIAVAIATAIILFVPRFHASRTTLLLWNTAGLIDIVFVAVTALRIGLRDWQGMAPLRELPLSLLPTFIVPLIIASHVFIFVRLARPDKIESH